jgi:ferredoxin
MVTLVVRDSSGDELGRIPLSGEKTILDECAESGIDLPFSCHAGACMTCSSKVISGKEYIDEEFKGQKYIDTDDDVVLTCISGVKKEAVDAQDEKIIEVQMLM